MASPIAEHHVDSYRFLQAESNITSGNFTNIAPTTSPTSNYSYGDKDAAKGFGFFTLCIVALVAGLAGWLCWKRYKQRVEQRMLDFRSAQADRVLGDMQMIPNEDLDNDLI